jgi:hypothetical protein
MEQGWAGVLEKRETNANSQPFSQAAGRDAL